MQHIQNWSLMILCSLSGLVMVTGSFLLLWNRLASLSDDGKSETDVNLFDKIKFKTNYPVLVMFFFGALLLAFPVYSSVTACRDPAYHLMPPLRMVHLKGRVGDRSKGAKVQVVAVVHEFKVGAGEEVDFSVPYVEGRKYVVKYMDKSGRHLINDEDVLLMPGKEDYKLEGVDPEAALADEAGEAAPVASQTRVEQKSVVDEFKSAGGGLR